MKKKFTNKEQLILELHKRNKIIANLKKEKIKWHKIENQLKAKKDELTERVKELNCLYNISKILGQKKHSLDYTIKKIIDIMLPAWKYKNHSCVRIALNNREYKSSNYKETEWKLRHDLTYFGKKMGFVEICYIENVSERGGECFLPAEKMLIRAIAELIGSIIEQKETNKDIKESAIRLEQQKKELEEKNIALKEILAQIEMEKKDIKEQIIINIDHLIMPTLMKLKDSTSNNDHLQRYVSILQKNLEEITASFTKRIIDNRIRLSVREMEICNMIKSGLTSKEIASLFSLSVLTVERHRHNIRKKFGIANEKINLTTYLQNM